jgi:putative ABC transport system permease protein
MLSADSWFGEIRGAVRGLVRSPWLTAAALATIGIGAGPSVVIVSAVRAAASPPIPFPEPDRLVVLSREVDGRSRFPWSFPKFDAMRQQMTSADLAAVAYCPLTLSDRGEKRPVIGEAASSNLFALLQVHPTRGRTFTAEEDEVPLGHPVAIVSESFRRSAFGAEAEPIGRTLELNGRAFVVVGVVPDGTSMSPTLLGLRPAELWIPLMMAPIAIPDQKFAQRLFQEPLVTWFTVLGRVKEGSSLRSAEAEARVIFERLVAERPTPGITTDRLEFRNFQAYATDPRLISNLLLLQVGAMLVFGISIFNLAHIVSVRAVERARDTAVCLALGAHPARLIARRVVEAVVLGGGGGGLAIALAWVARRSLLLLRNLAEPGLLPRDGLDNVRVDTTVVLAALVLAIAASLISTIVATRQAMPRAIMPVLQAGHIAMKAGFRALRVWKPRGATLTAQIGVAVALVSVALFVLSGFSRTVANNPGLSGAAVFAIELRPPAEADRVGREFAQLAVQAREISGVGEASVVSCLPVSYQCQSAGFARDGDAVDLPPVGFHAVLPDSFRTLGIRLSAGRDFAVTDTADTPLVALLSEKAAAPLGPNPIGQRIRLSGAVPPDTAFEVIGIVPDVSYASLNSAPKPDVYVSYLQVPHGRGFLVARANGDSGAIASILRERLAGDTFLKTAAVHNLGQMVSAEVSRMRTVVGLVTGVAGLALLLAGIGLFAVLYHLVARTTHEIGMRIAMGATRRDIARLVLSAVPPLAAAGAGVGALIAFPLVRHVAGLTGGPVTPDAGSIVVSLLLTVAIAVMAAALPAYRASRIDPIDALREP